MNYHSPELREFAVGGNRIDKYERRFRSLHLF